MDNLIDEFISEAGELLDEIESELLNFDPSQPLPKETYSLIFRNFHSLKGSSGMMGLDELQRHTHLLEDKFQSYENRLQSDDVLSIQVSSNDNQGVAAFNIATSNGILGSDNAVGQPRFINYIIRKDGTIEFPLLGKIKLILGLHE